MPKPVSRSFFAALRSGGVLLKERVVEKPTTPLTDDYLDFMQQKIDAEKTSDFKLTPTSPSGW